MRIHRLYPGSFGANSYLLIARDGTAAVVDPSPDADTVLGALRGDGANISRILLTHGHFDHILSLDTLRDRTGVPAGIHENDLDLPSDARKNAFEAFFRQKRVWRTPEETFRDGDRIAIGSETVTVLHTPGHTAGSACFLVNDGHDLLTGDTLFAENYGRTDLYSEVPATCARLSGDWQRSRPIPLFTPVMGNPQGSATRLRQSELQDEGKGNHYHGF